MGTGVPYLYLGVPDPIVGAVGVRLGSRSPLWGCPTAAVLYPFGPGVGDAATPHEDDGMSPKIPLSEKFSFYGQSYTDLYVSPGPIESLGGLGGGWVGRGGGGDAVGWGHLYLGSPWVGVTMGWGHHGLGSPLFGVAMIWGHHGLGSAWVEAVVIWGHLYLGSPWVGAAMIWDRHDLGSPWVGVTMG